MAASPNLRAGLGPLVGIEPTSVCMDKFVTFWCLEEYTHPNRHAEPKRKPSRYQT